jgi:quinol monooxygenase YgiN
MRSTAAAAQPAGPAHAVTYLESAPAMAEEALGLLRAHAGATTRADAASLGVELRRRLDRPRHFAMVERWRGAAPARRPRPALIAP